MAQGIPGASRNWKRGRNKLSAFRQTQPSRHLDFSPVRPTSAFIHQNCQRMKLCCFKPLSL